MSAANDLYRFADACDRVAQLLPQAIIEAETETLNEALEIAHELSHGEYKTAQLRKMGHPYSKAYPRPPQDAAIINLQDGTFDTGWQIHLPVLSGGHVTSSLVNDSEHARELNDGTDRMISRPTIQRIEERIQPARQARLKAAFTDTMPGGKKNKL